MSSDKSKENKKKSEESAEALTTAERSRISDVFDEGNEQTIEDKGAEKVADTPVESTKEPVEVASKDDADVVDAKETDADVIDDAKETVADVIEDAKEIVADVIEDAKDIVGDVIDGAKDIGSSASQAVADAIESAKDTIDEVLSDDDGNASDVEHSDVEDGDGEVKGIAAYFNHPDHLMYAAEQARDAKFEIYDAYSPFPIHGMDDAMGLERSWIPWVTFGAGLVGFSSAFGLQFGIMGFDWPMIFGGRPFIAWPSFVPILFELTVLFAGVTTGLVALVAAGCFRKPFIIDKDITNDQFVLWISADDKAFDIDSVTEFMKKLNPHTIRAVREGHK